MLEPEKAPDSSVASPPLSSGNRYDRLPSQPVSSGDPASRSDVAAVLLGYLQTRLGLTHLEFAEEPSAFVDGWETYSYGFRLRASDLLPPAFARPLTVRIYCGSAGISRARREILVLRHLYRLHYPVPEPVLLEENCSYFGGPFLVMAQVCGPTLLHALLRRPWKLFWGPVDMANIHVRLHQLPTTDFPARPGCLLTRRFEEMAAAIRDYGLHGLRPGFDWLFTNRPEPPKHPRIVHLDFHPLNLIEERKHALVVLDWNEADLGDRHADVGTTMMLMDCLPGVKLTRLERLMLLSGRFYFVHAYLSTYRRQLPLEDNKLAYYRALAALHRLCNYGRWLQDGPQISGNKPAILQLTTDDQRRTLERYFRKWTGTTIRL